MELSKRIKNTKFIVDDNLFKLCKWIRLLGYDAKYYSEVDDTKLIKIAIVEDRIILTRNKRILERKIVVDLSKYLESDTLKEEQKCKALLILSNNYIEQLKQVVERVKLDTEKFLFTRCMLCNDHLEKIEKCFITELIPQKVFDGYKNFSKCKGCGKIYWFGTHCEDISKKIQMMRNDELKITNLNTEKH